MCALLAQPIDKTQALELIWKNRLLLSVPEDEIRQGQISDAYSSVSSRLDYVYFQQRVHEIPVFNQVLSLTFRNGTLVSQSGTFLPDLSDKIRGIRVFPSVTPVRAAEQALRLKKITLHDPLNPVALQPGRKYTLGRAGVATEPITAELMWVPQQNGAEVRLAWQIYLVPSSSSDYWMIRLDAHSLELLSENNLTVYCDWDDSHGGTPTSDGWVLASKTNRATLPTGSLFGWAAMSRTAQAPSLVNTASYRVIPHPYESPRHAPAGTQLVTNPWTQAPGNATTLKWHSIGTTDYNYTRGNNVWAQEDVNGNNGTGTPATSTTAADPLSFDFNPDFNAPPTQTTPVANQPFNTTNLFYWNNVVHDITYLYGFDEAAGNFQVNNQGRGGAGNDAVLADAQDGSGTNNANFSTPSDGGSGRMQMFLWNAVPTLTVNTPATIAGQYQAVESNFSTANKLAAVGNRIGQVVYYNDNAAGTTHEACAGLPVNSVLGKIALIDRGNCNFTVKVKNAQNAGAIAVIMVNNVQGNPIIMGGTDNTITIPAVMVSINDGQVLKNNLNNNLNVTLSVGQPLDGDVDNGVIAHEYTHGISNRLTGGPSNASCLANAEQMGEGWSDYYSLMLTQDWATSTLTSGQLQPRGIGTYVVGQLPNQLGIRTQRYCTDLDINNKIFANTITAQQHERGEIWCATLWDMTWNIIQQTGVINPNIYDTTSDGGNSVALRLVTEGMKLQPCNPGFIDGRNAILKADSLIYGGVFNCAIREAFRRRGMGLYASQGSSSSVTDQVADYTPVVTLKKVQSTDEAQEGDQVTYTTVVNSCSPLSGYVLRDTLPANVTYVSGGTYEAATRVVSFPVDFANGQTQSFSYVASVNPGSFFAEQTLLNESISGGSVPATFTLSSTTANTWSVSTAQSVSAPGSLFTPNAAVASDQRLETVNALPMGPGTHALSFFQAYNTQAGVDGGLVEVSTNNGTSWTDVSALITTGYYNSALGTGSGNPLAGRRAWSGNSNGFVPVSINLSAFASQPLKLRFRFGSNSTVGGNGWYVDDIVLKNEPVVNIRSSLFDNTGLRVAYTDTFTRVVQTVTCTQVSLNSQPAAVTACGGTDAVFSISAAGTAPEYQWQVSTDGGNTFTDIPGASGPSLTLPAVSATLNGNLYRVRVSNDCPSNATSAAALLNVNAPATLLTPPQGNAVCVGAAATFSATADGNAITYQWQVSTDGGITFTDIPSANANTYTISSVGAAQNGNRYRLVVTGCNGPVTSPEALLTVSNQASITQQPANTPACNGGTATLNVTALGSQLTYQWQVSTDGGVTYTDVPGATQPTLTLNSISTGMNNHLYQVVIGSNCGAAVTSAASLITVSDPAVITAQPSATTICEGTSTTLSVGATGSNISYQWQVSTDGGSTYSDIAGAQQATLALNAVALSQNNNLYRVLISSCSPDGLPSDPALLQVNAQASFSTQPADQTLCTGSTASFSATATGNGVTYQWQISTDGGITFSDIAGAVTETLTLNNITLTQNNERYRVRISNPCTNELLSNSARLTVNDQPAVTAQPQNASACPGGQASFSVTASGQGLSYQWQVSTDGGNSFSDIPGAVNPILTLSGLSSADNNRIYRCLIGSSCSAAGIPSEPAVLTLLSEATIVSAPADASGCAGANVTLTAEISGTNVTYQWQVSTDGGVTWTDISGANSSTLTLNNVTLSQNNHRYRVKAGADPCGVTTGSAILSVTPSPSVVLTANPVRNLFPGLTTTLTATSTPPGSAYNWFRNGILIPGVTGNTLIVTYEDRGQYTAKDLGGCDNISNTLIISDSASTRVFIYPNPNDGEFIVRYFNDVPGVRNITLYDAKGAKVYAQSFTLASGYDRMDVSVKSLAAGVYLLVLTDQNGNRLNATKMVKR